MPASVNWNRPPRGADHPCLQLDPSAERWPYGRAIKEMAKTPVARKGAPAITHEDNVGRMDRFIETLAFEPKESLANISSKRDRDLVTQLASLMLSE